jgi:hypothetical protein
MPIGQLLYVTTKTQRNIGVAADILSRKGTPPTEIHWSAATRLLRCLEGTQDCGIE